MQESDKISAEELLRMTTEVAAAYVSNNAVPAGQLSDVIRTIHVSLIGLNQPGAGAPQTPPTPAVAVKKSVTPDYIICVEDGTKLRMLKRLLRSTDNRTPVE